jgi:hypothetical protein
MYKPKKTKRFQPGGLVDSERNPVRDGSNQPIMTGSFPEEDEITARGRAKNAEMLKSFFNRATGRGKSAQDEAGKVAQMAAAKEKLAGEVQEMVKAKTPAAAVQSSKASDGDVDERDRRMEAAASAPKRMPTRPGQGTSTPKPSVSKAPVKPKPSTAPAASTSRGRGAEKGSAPKQTMGGPYRDEGRNRPAPAAPEKRPGTALPINPSVLRQREEAEKKRDAARAAKRKESEAKEEKFTKDLSSDPGQVALKKKREEEDKMSPGQRSAARGKAFKEFFGMAKGGSVSSASKRADGIAQRGKTRGKVY